MSPERPLANRVRARRAARGWTQDDLAARAGISRAGVSAIEMGRLVPSAAAALALAGALDCRVEDLFSLGQGEGTEPTWAWPPKTEPSRYWHASVAGRKLLYPVEATNLGVIGSDGTYARGRLQDHGQTAAGDTLVIASCDPAVGLLATEFQRQSGFRMLVLERSSREALALLSQGLVHAAGLHLAIAQQRNKNVDAAREALRTGFSLLRVAQWQEGLAVAPGLHLGSVRSALRAKVRWVGREPGAAARELLDELLESRPPPRRIAFGHRAVAEAVRCGWADAGVCVRLAGEEAGLDFFILREEQYDLCYRTDGEGDPRLQAVVETIRSRAYRDLLRELPGYDAADTGELQRIV